MEKNNKRNLEQIYRSAISGLYARLRNNYDYIYRTLGDDGLKLISDMSREYGMDIALRARKRVTDNSISSVVDYILRIFETMTFGKNSIRLTELSDTRTVIKIEDCPLRPEKPEVCIAHTTMEKTVIEELNPGLTFRIDKQMPAGDAYCEYIIEVKPLKQKHIKRKD